MKRCIFRTSLLLAILSIIITGCTFDDDIEVLGKVPVKVSGTGISSLSAKFEWLQNNAENGKIYEIEVTGSNVEYISETLDYQGKNITLRITGAGFPVNPSGDNPIFEVESGVTLVLDNITLSSHWNFSDPDPANYANAPLVKVNYGGVLVINDGTVITHNFTNTDGGGVFVDRGTFIMNGGVISGNNAKNGGGVYVNGGKFIMNGGTICDNKAVTYIYGGFGGGVCVENGGNFSINANSIISGNEAIHSGGGVYIFNSNFFKTGGNIYGDDAENNDDKNYVSGENSYGHAIWAQYSVMGESYAVLEVRMRDDTAGRNEALSLSLKGSIWSWEGNWEAP